MVIGKLKLSCPNDKPIENLTPQFIFCPLSSLLREGNSSLWIQGQCLMKVKGLGTRSQGQV